MGYRIQVEIEAGWSTLLDRFIIYIPRPQTVATLELACDYYHMAGHILSFQSQPGRRFMPVPRETQVGLARNEASAQAERERRDGEWGMDLEEAD